MHESPGKILQENGNKWQGVTACRATKALGSRILYEMPFPWSPGEDYPNSSFGSSFGLCFSGVIKQGSGPSLTVAACSGGSWDRTSPGQAALPLTHAPGTKAQAKMLYLFSWICLSLATNVSQVSDRSHASRGGFHQRHPCGCSLAPSTRSYFKSWTSPN